MFDNNYFSTRADERRDLAAGLVGMLCFTLAGTVIVSILFTVL